MKISSFVLVGLAVGSTVIGAACVTGTEPVLTSLNCDSYCSSIMSKCLIDDQGTNNLVYKNQQTCVDMCGFFTVGTVKDTTDTLGCRSRQLSNLDDPHTPSERHDICLSAAAYSVTCAASVCDAFCSLDEKICAGSLSPYPDANACLSTCKTFDPAFTGNFVNSTGDNLQCRAYHLENAVIDDASHLTHCPHTGKSSAVCTAGAQDGGTMDAATSSDASSKDASSE